MMITCAFLLAIISVILFGCASPPYIPPQLPDAAILTFTNKAEIEVILQGFKNAEDCSGGRLNFNDRRKLGPGEKTTISIAPEEEFSFRFHAANKPYFRYGCLMPATFTPQEGIAYFSTFDLIDLHCDDDSHNTDLHYAKRLGSFRYVTSNYSLWRNVEDPLERGACGGEWAASTSGELVFPLCYVSITRMKNGNVVREPSFTLRTQIQPWLESGPSCQ